MITTTPPTEAGDYHWRPVRVIPERSEAWIKNTDGP